MQYLDDSLISDRSELFDMFDVAPIDTTVSSGILAEQLLQRYTMKTRLIQDLENLEHQRLLVCDRFHNEATTEHGVGGLSHLEYMYAKTGQSLSSVHDSIRLLLNLLRYPSNIEGPTLEDAEVFMTIKDEILHQSAHSDRQLQSFLTQLRAKEKPQALKTFVEAATAEGLSTLPPWSEVLTAPSAPDGEVSDFDKKVMVYMQELADVVGLVTMKKEERRDWMARGGMSAADRMHKVITEADDVARELGSVHRRTCEDLEEVESMLKELIDLELNVIG